MAVNLWPNPSLEEGVSEWTPTISMTVDQSAAQAWHGDYSMSLLTTGNYKSAKSDAVPVSESTQYTFSFYVYPTDATTIIEIGLYDQDDNDLFGHVASTYPAGQWTRVSITRPTGTGDTGLKAQFTKQTGADAVFYVDGLMLETGASASTFPVNLWPNADLEAGIDDWNLEGGASEILHSSVKAWQGTYSLYVDPAGDYDGAVSDVKSIVSESTQYALSFRLWTDDATQEWQIRVLDQDGNLINNEEMTLTADVWNLVTNIFTTGAGDTGIKLTVRTKAVGLNNVFWVDAIMVEAGAAASTWVNYETSGVEITPATLETEMQIFNPLVLNGVAWDMGPFIYTESSGVEINPPALQTQMQIFDPVVYAVDVPTAINPPLLQTEMQMFNPTVRAFRPFGWGEGSFLVNIYLKIRCRWNR